MELLKSIIERIFGVIIEGTLISDANRTTSMIYYQPSVPSNIIKYNKINKV